MRNLEFFFDYASPWSYLADTQIDHVVHRSSALLTYRPILLGGLFKRIGTPLVPLHSYPPLKQQYLRWDMERWAHHWAVPFRFPSRFPLDTVAAQRLTFLVDDADKDLLVDRLFQACWVEDRDPADRAVLASIVEECGLDHHILSRIDAIETKATLRSATDEAVARGVCGAPTFVVDGRMFWGQDRLLFVEAALNGWRPASESLDPSDPYAAAPSAP